LLDRADDDWNRARKWLEKNLSPNDWFAMSNGGMEEGHMLLIIKRSLVGRKRATD
jgi:hypothetical protein